MKVPEQPEINIGMIGHVDHGKTTLTKALSGEWTDRHSEEVKRGISIRLGYADVAFYKCPDCEGAKAYSTQKKCPGCGAATEFLRAVSFVDAPGHETLMATMLSGAALMSGALLLVAANERCPQPQTREHLMALSIVGIDRIVIVQNKIDIVSRERALENYREIKDFVRGTVAENAPIIPVSANRGVNIDLLIEAIEKAIVEPAKRNLKAAPVMHVARSFDINSPGTVPKDLRGGVIGGTLLQGKLKVGDEIEVAPGRRVVNGGKTTYEPITAKITSLEAGERSVKEVLPGGLIAIGTELDPSITKSDGLTGRVVGKPGSMPPVVSAFKMKITLLDRVVGSAADMQVEGIKSNEPLMLSVGTATTVGVVKSAHEGYAEVTLKLPVCILPDQRVAISRRISNKWRLIGYGVVSDRDADRRARHERFADAVRGRHQPRPRGGGDPRRGQVRGPRPVDRGAQAFGQQAREGRAGPRALPRDRADRRPRRRRRHRHRPEGERVHPHERQGAQAQGAHATHTSALSPFGDAPRRRDVSSRGPTQP